VFSQRTFVAMSFSDSKMQDYKDAFGSISEGNETIPVTELPSMLRAFGFTLTEKDMFNIVSHFGKKELSFDEFVQIIKNTSGKRAVLSEDDVQDAMWMYDRDDSGLISIKDFKEMLQTSPGEPLTDAEVQELVQKLDLGNATSIKYDDVAKLLHTKRAF